MAEFNRIALLKTHQPVPVFLNYLVADLTELAGLAAAIRPLVDDLTIPVGPADRDPLGAFEAFMARRRPDLVGLSVFTGGARSAARYAEIAKRHGAFVVAGGYHPSALPEEMLASAHVDAVVRGEGEETLRELIARGPSEEVAGLSYRDGERIVHTPDRELIADLDTLPLPLRELRPMRFGLDGLHYHVDSVFTSRGCRARCTFCANHLVGKRWRERSLDHVMAELEAILPSRNGSRKQIKLWDPNFMTDVERTAALCDRIIEHGLHRKFQFIAETRVEDIVRGREVLTRMREAGFVRLGSGVESPNEDTLRLIRKGVRPESVALAGELLDRAGIHFSKFFVIGHPNESPEDILRYADFAATPGVRKQSAQFFVLTPYPGTQSRLDYEAAGTIASNDWDLYNNYLSVIEPNGISQLALQSLQGAITIQYSLLKRVERGDSTLKLAARTLVLAVAFARAAQSHTSHGQDQIEACLWETLANLRNVPASRSPRSPGRTRQQSVTLRFHHRGQPPVTVRFENRDGGEPIRVERGWTARRRGLRHLTIDLSVEHLLDLSASVDVRATGNSLATLRFRPSAMKLEWLLSLAGQLARTAAVLARLGLFALRARLLGTPPTKARDRSS